MKKVIFVFVAMMSICSVCFAGPYVKSGDVKPAAASMISVGVVNSVTVGDPVKKESSTIVITGSTGAQESYTLERGASVYDLKMKGTTLDKITKGQTVRIKYHKSASGDSEATVIKVMK